VEIVIPLYNNDNIKLIAKNNIFEHLQNKYHDLNMNKKIKIIDVKIIRTNYYENNSKEIRYQFFLEGFHLFRRGKIRNDYIFVITDTQFDVMESRNF
jgi:hypothetical protein